MISKLAKSIKFVKAVEFPLNAVAECVEEVAENTINSEMRDTDNALDKVGESQYNLQKIDNG